MSPISSTSPPSRAFDTASSASSLDTKYGELSTVVLALKIYENNK